MSLTRATCNSRGDTTKHRRKKGVGVGREVIGENNDGVEGEDGIDLGKSQEKT